MKNLLLSFILSTTNIHSTSNPHWLMTSPLTDENRWFPSHRIAPIAGDANTYSTPGLSTENTSPITMTSSTTPQSIAAPFIPDRITLYSSVKRDVLSTTKLDNKLDKQLVENADNDLVIIKDDEYKKLKLNNAPSAKFIKTYFSTIDKAFEKAMLFTTAIEQRQNVNDMMVPFYVSMRALIKDLDLDYDVTNAIDQKFFIIRRYTFDHDANYVKFLISVCKAYKSNGAINPIPEGMDINGIREYIITYWYSAFDELFLLKIRELTEKIKGVTYICDDLREFLLDDFIPEQITKVRKEFGELQFSRNLNGGSVLQQTLQSVVILKSELDIVNAIIEWKYENSKHPRNGNISVSICSVDHCGFIAKFLNNIGFEDNQIDHIQLL